MWWFPPWQNTLTCENKVCRLKLKPLRSLSLLNKILQSSCALRYFHTFPVCAADQWELMRHESKAESQSKRRVKDPEPVIIFVSSMVDYIACCFLTGDFTVYQADTLPRRTSCASPLLPLEITGTDNNRLCMICLCLCSLSTSAGHTVNLVSSSTAWKLRGWLELTFIYPNTTQGGCIFPATLDFDRFDHVHCQAYWSSSNALKQWITFLNSAAQ